MSSVFAHPRLSRLLPHTPHNLHVWNADFALTLTPRALDTSRKFWCARTHSPDGNLGSKGGGIVQGHTVGLFPGFSSCCVFMANHPPSGPRKQAPLCPAEEQSLQESVQNSPEDLPLGAATNTAELCTPALIPSLSHADSHIWCSGSILTRLPGRNSLQTDPCLTSFCVLRYSCT